MRTAYIAFECLHCILHKHYDVNVVLLFIAEATINKQEKITGQLINSVKM